MEKPAEPDTFAFPSAPTRFIPSFQSPVPISGRPWLPTARLRSSARAQCSNRVPLLSDTVARNTTRLVPPRSGPVKEGNDFIEETDIASDFKVVDDRVRQPEQIIGDAGPHAPAGWRMPPVLDIALHELPRGGAQHLRARDVAAARP